MPYQNNNGSGPELHLWANGENIAYLKVCPLVDQGHPSSVVDARISQIRELIRLRDGLDQLDVLSETELQDILEYVCIS